MPRLVMIRHGESTWNQLNKFTGWADVSLSERGIEESRTAGKLLKNEMKFEFDVAYTSVLERATKTLDIILEEMGLSAIPVHNSWRLNERCYGALQGLNKREMAEKFGDEQILQWRRGFDIRPPALEKTDEQYPGNDARYGDVSEEDLPVGESLKDTIKRVLPYWNETIVPDLMANKRVIISAHGNSLRALIKHIENIPEDQITSLEIPTGVPQVFEFDEEMRLKEKYFCGDQDAIRQSIEEVRNQGKSKTSAAG